MADIFEIAGRIHSTSQEHVTSPADEILDTSQNKKQHLINADVARHDSEINSPTNGLNKRVEDIEALGQIGDTPVETNASNIISNTSLNGKVPSASAVNGVYNAVAANAGYYACDSEASTAAKVVEASGYVLTVGGCIKIKMTNANTADDDATLNINSTGAKALYYAGERVSATNSWEEGETVEVYYDGTNFYANNVAGGSSSGDGAFDVSAKYPTSGVEGGNTYTLEGALAVLNDNLSARKKKGGMSIKFISSSNNKYIQYRLTADEWSIDTEDWAIADEGVYVENPEWIRVLVDAKNHILAGIKADGSVEWSVGVPTPVKEYVTEHLAEIMADITEGLATKVDKEDGKSLVDSGFADGISYVDNSEFVYVKTDKEGKVLWAIKTDGDIFYGAGVPSQVVNYINEKIAELSLDEYEDIVAFLNDYIGSDTTLKVMIDGINAAIEDKLDKDGLDPDALNSVHAVENPEFMEVELDADDKVLGGRKVNGTKFENCGYEIKGTVVIEGAIFNICQSPEWIYVFTDSQNKIIAGVRPNGNVFINKIEGLNDNIYNIINLLFTNKLTLDKFSEIDGHLLWENSPIEGNGITQEELNQQLANYPTISAADNRYASKALETTVNNQSTQISDIDDSINSIEQDINTVNDGLSRLTSPLPSGAIAGDNIWTGNNQFMQPISGVFGTNDNNVALYGQFKNTLHRFENAADYGFEPTSTAAVNAAALNNALVNGNKTIIISKPGEYLINDTILVYDNTEIICGSGVVIKKANAKFVHLFLNAGAETRTTNRNLRFIGLHLSMNGYGNAAHSLESALYGLRGALGLLCVENVYIDNFFIDDLDLTQYAIHVNTFKYLTVVNSYIAGEKDGLHISDGTYFTIKNCNFNTKDDFIALNATDWQSSNCVDGTLSYGCIENVNSKYTGRLLMNLGAFVDWYSGIEIHRGDRVVNNGRIYRACTNSPEDTIYTSTTEPTITTFYGVQQDSSGFYWKLMKDAVYYKTDVEHVTIKNWHSETNVLAVRIDESGRWSRALHPTVQAANYPGAKHIVLEDCIFSGSQMYGSNSGKSFENISFIRCKLAEAIEVPSKDSGVTGQMEFTSCDFSKINIYSYHFNIGENIYLKLNDVTGISSYIRFKNDVCHGRLNSDFPIENGTNIEQPKKGDFIKDQDGTPKIYNGSTWKNII